MRELLDFILSKTMLKALIGVGIAWVLILGSTWLGLNLNSRPWSKRTVPSVEGLMKDSAMQVLNELNLISYDSSILDEKVKHPDLPQPIIDDTEDNQFKLEL